MPIYRTSPCTSEMSRLVLTSLQSAHAESTIYTAEVGFFRLYSVQDQTQNSYDPKRTFMSDRFLISINYNKTGKSRLKYKIKL